MGMESISVILISGLEMGVIKLFPISGKGRQYSGKSSWNSLWKPDQLFFFFTYAIVMRG